MFYPELWTGKSNRLGKLPQGTGDGEHCVNRDRWNDRRDTAETVYREAKGGSTVCGGSAWNAIRDFHSTEDPCHPGTDWDI